MYKYFKQLPTDVACVIRTTDNACIPLDELNADYQKFLDDINANVDVEGTLPDDVINQARARALTKQLKSYKEAVDRLSRYVLSEGRGEIHEMVAGPHQQFNEETQEFEPIMIEFVTPAIEPLPATITITNEDGTTEEIRNPAIVKDEEERAAAQAIVDATPEEVKAAA